MLSEGWKRTKVFPCYLIKIFNFKNSQISQKVLLHDSVFDLFPWALSIISIPKKINICKSDQKNIPKKFIPSNRVHEPQQRNPQGSYYNFLSILHRIKKKITDETLIILWAASCEFVYCYNQSCYRHHQGFFYEWH